MLLFHVLLRLCFVARLIVWLLVVLFVWLCVLFVWVVLVVRVCLFVDLLGCVFVRSFARVIVVFVSELDCLCNSLVA